MEGAELVDRHSEAGTSRHLEWACSHQDSTWVIETLRAAEEAIMAEAGMTGEKAVIQGAATVIIKEWAAAIDIRDVVVVHRTMKVAITIISEEAITMVMKEEDLLMIGMVGAESLQVVEAGMGRHQAVKEAQDLGHRESIIIEREADEMSVIEQSKKWQET